MGVLTDFVVAKADEADAVARSACPYQDFPGVAAKGIEEAMLGSLEAILSGEVGTFNSVTVVFRAQRTQNGPWVFEVSVSLVQRLAELGPKQVADVASKWIQTEELAYDPRPLDAVTQCLQGLADLSRQAVAEGKCLFMWVCL